MNESDETYEKRIQRLISIQKIQRDRLVKRQEDIQINKRKKAIEAIKYLGDDIYAVFQEINKNDRENKNDKERKNRS